MSGRPELFVRTRLRHAQVWGPQADRVTAMVAADTREYAGSGTWLVPPAAVPDVMAYCSASRLLAIAVRP